MKKISLRHLLIHLVIHSFNRYVYITFLCQVWLQAIGYKGQTRQKKKKHVDMNVLHEDNESYLEARTYFHCKQRFAMIKLCLIKILNEMRG